VPRSRLKRIGEIEEAIMDRHVLLTATQLNSGRKGTGAMMRSVLLPAALLTVTIGCGSSPSEETAGSPSAVSAPLRHAGKTSKDFVPPVVFQAAGPSAAAIQSSVDAFRAVLGDPNNGNAAGPLTSGRREINWDGGSTTNQTTGVAANPFDGFLITRGALFTTPDGTGFVQAPPAADPVEFPPGGLAGLFNNPTYGTIFRPFSPLRLFSAIGSNITETRFFVPGGGNIAATTTGFGAVFTDVDRPDGSGPGCKRRGSREASTQIEYFGADGELLFSSFVPSSPGDGSLSFFGIMFRDATIAQVRITSGNVAPGPDDDAKRDVVMMDDFIYGEPQPRLH
jgi:hypothetical protein